MHHDESITTLPGVGGKMAEKLQLLGIRTICDLWFHLPIRYENHTKITPSAAANPNENVIILGLITSVSSRATRNGTMLECQLRENGSCSPIKAVFWHLYPNQIREFKTGKYLLCYGQVNRDTFGCSMSHPDYEILSNISEISLPDHLTPIYSTTKGITSEKIQKIADKALQLMSAQDPEELLPAGENITISLQDALKKIHHPPIDADLNQLQEHTSPEQRRLILEELTANTLSVYTARTAVKKHAAIPLISKGILQQALLSSLKFTPTGAQMRVTREICNDLAGNTPMLRLLQGDVGSGKTLVAALTALCALECGYQVALMAPTEILATQHYTKLNELFGNLGISVTLLVGKLKAREKKTIQEQIALGNAKLVIGTHALFQDQVVFKNLAYVIIDEQHRFGVEQRYKLLMKGSCNAVYPHQLVMTATPIPRTLAMTSYADLNVSTIDELPPGRKPITTKIITSNARDKLLQRIHEVCTQKHWQVYWVCSLIEESEVLDCAAAEKECNELSNALPDLSIGLVHGRMTAHDKQAVMDKFKNGEVDVLVATTVIEVGVDVPNANIIIIEDPERLGLAQLHQLRGRVGRGQEQAFCILFTTGPISTQGRERLEFLSNNHNGLKIAEKDLEIRGPGEYLGTKQTGVAAMKIADLLRDQYLVPEANRLAQDIATNRPDLVPKLIARWINSNEAFTHA